MLKGPKPPPESAGDGSRDFAFPSGRGRSARGRKPSEYRAATASDCGSGTGWPPHIAGQAVPHIFAKGPGAASEQAGDDCRAAGEAALKTGQEIDEAPLMVLAPVSENVGSLAGRHRRP